MYSDAGAELVRPGGVRSEAVEMEGKRGPSCSEVEELKEKSVTIVAATYVAERGPTFSPSIKK